MAKINVPLMTVSLTIPAKFIQYHVENAIGELDCEFEPADWKATGLNKAQFREHLYRDPEYLKRIEEEAVALFKDSLVDPCCDIKWPKFLKDAEKILIKAEKARLAKETKNELGEMVLQLTKAGYKITPPKK
jgi:hypothetical protein